MIPNSSGKSNNSAGGSGSVHSSEKFVGHHVGHVVNRLDIAKSRFAIALEQAENENTEDIKNIEYYRLAAKKYMSKSRFGFIYEVLNMILSVVSALDYIVSTYLTSPGSQSAAHQSTVTSLILMALFSCDWLLQYFLADIKVMYLIGYFSMVDLLSIIPTFITYGTTCPKLESVSTGNQAVLYILFGLRTVRILRSVRTFNLLYRIDDAVNRYIGEIGISISVMILFFASVMQFLESTTNPYDFHTWMYYIWVTIATVGYGDITPDTTLGRIAAMAMIGFAIVSVPSMTNTLIEKMALQSVYARAVYTPKGKTSRHILICGDLSSTNLNDFFEELFHEDHDNADLNAVLLFPTAPTVEIILMLRDPKYSLSLTYLEGSALVDVDLRRAKAEYAEAIFIMTNKFSANPDEEDAKAILQNLSIKRYVSFFSYSVYNTLYCMQIIRPDNLRQLTNSETNKIDANNLVVCLNEIKMGVLAKSVVYPGVNTFIMNLITSFSDETFQAIQAQNELNDISNRKSHAIFGSVGSAGGKYEAATNVNSPDKDFDIVDDGSKPWLNEYQKGCDWEIYTTTLSDIFIGSKFSDLSLALYEKLGVVLFALQLTLKTGQSKVILNPANFVIPDKSEFRIEAFVLAKNKASSDLSFSKGQHDVGAFQSIVQVVSSAPAKTRRASVMVAPHVGGTFVAPGAHSNKQTFLSNMPLFGASTGSGHSSHNLISAVPSFKGIMSETGNNVRPRHSNPDKLHQLQQQQEQQQPPKKNKVSYWKSLKRSALLEKKVESFSYQEVLQKLEDEHLTKNYYLRVAAVELAEVTVRTNVIDEIPFINNHIIVIGKDLSNLYDLIRPLRAKYLGNLKYITILHPFDIPYDVWQRISNFDAVVIVRGSPLVENDLRRAGIFRAQQVIILAGGNENMGSSRTAGMEALVDSDAIFAYQCVKRMNPNTQVVVEIVNQINIGYLVTDTQASTNANDYKFSNQFAAGTLFTTSLLDSLLCQAYYNPHIIQVVNKLISGVDQLERNELAAQASQKVAENSKHGGGDDDSSSDSDGGDSFGFSPASAKHHHIHSKLSNIAESCMYQIPIPENLTDKTYGGLFKLLSKDGILPLGLLRGTLANLNIGPKSNKMPYVYTNPDKSAELYACDRIFVLSTKVQQSQHKTSVKDWILDIQMAQSRAREPSLHLGVKQRSDSYNKSISQLEKSHRNLENRISQLSNDVNKKFNAIMSKLENPDYHIPEGLSRINTSFLASQSMDITTQRSSLGDDVPPPASVQSTPIVGGASRKHASASAGGVVSQEAATATRERAESSAHSVQSNVRVRGHSSDLEDEMVMSARSNTSANRVKSTSFAEVVVEAMPPTSSIKQRSSPPSAKTSPSTVPKVVGASPTNIQAAIESVAQLMTPTPSAVVGNSTTASATAATGSPVDSPTRPMLPSPNASPSIGMRKTVSAKLTSNNSSRIALDAVIEEDYNAVSRNNSISLKDTTSPSSRNAAAAVEAVQEALFDICDLPLDEEPQVQPLQRQLQQQQQSEQPRRLSNREQLHNQLIAEIGGAESSQVRTRSDDPIEALEDIEQVTHSGEHSQTSDKVASDDTEIQNFEETTRDTARQDLKPDVIELGPVMHSSGSSIANNNNRNYSVGSINSEALNRETVVYAPIKTKPTPSLISEQFVVPRAGFKTTKKVVVSGPTVDMIFGRPPSPARLAAMNAAAASSSASIAERSVRSAPASRHGAVSSNTSISSLIINNNRSQSPEKGRTAKEINTEDYVEDYEYILNGVRYYAADNTSVGSASVTNHNKHGGGRQQQQTQQQQRKKSGGNTESETNQR